MHGEESGGKKVIAPCLLKYFKFKVGTVVKMGLMDLGFTVDFDMLCIFNFLYLYIDILYIDILYIFL